MTTSRLLTTLQVRRVNGPRVRVGRAEHAPLFLFVSARATSSAIAMATSNIENVTQNQVCSGVGVHPGMDKGNPFGSITTNTEARGVRWINRVRDMCLEESELHPKDKIWAGHAHLYRVRVQTTPVFPGTYSLHIARARA